MHIHFDQIKDLITSGDLEQALKLLEDGTEGSSFSVEAAFLKAREFKHRNQGSMGLINEDAAQLEFNKITFSALELLEKIRHHFLLHEIHYGKLLFYETPRESFVPKEERQYQSVFQNEVTRHIGWELTLEYPPLVAPLQLKIMWSIAAANGQGAQKLYREFTIDPAWSFSWISDSWGFQEAGKWAPGKYVVEIHVGEAAVAKGDFEIS